MLLNRLTGQLFICVVFCGLRLSSPFPCFAQNNDQYIEVKGIVMDSLTNQPLIGATVMDKVSGKANVTSDNGSYQLIISKGSHELICSFIGYKSVSKVASFNSDVEIDFMLLSASVNVQEVTISSKARDKQIQNIQTGVISLSRKEVSGLPLFLGESDFYKAIQLMPGVQVSGEGNAAIYVRGGGYDQNLILLDQATVYNPTHLLGFYSVFNTDIINELTLIKSGIPAEYGNRISSVLDFSVKRTIPDSVRSNINIGILSAKANVDVPLFNHNGAFFLAARKIYLNSLLDVFRKTGFIKHSSILYKTGYDFYDINASLVLRISSKDRLFLSTYKGDDWFVLNSNTIDLHADMDWGNQIVSLSWNHMINSQFYIDNYITYSGYGLDMNLQQNQYNLALRSGITDFTYKNRITRILKKHKLRTGFSITRHDITPNTSQASSDSTTLNLGTTNHYNSYEMSGFLSDEYAISERLGVIAGFRFNTFLHVGAFIDYTHNSLGEIIDTATYKPGEIIKKYLDPEIRLSIRYLLSPTTSIKFSFNTNSQYVHLVNASSVTFPTDFWIPSSKLIKPQHGNQVSIGLYKNISDFETSIETYYKTFQNQIEFNKGIFNATDNTPLDENLIFGKGRAYGAEFLIRKSTGRFTGWFGYTISKTERSFDEIESGRWLPAKYDRPHDISLVTNYSYHDKWTFSAVFVFASGSTYTPVIGRYFIANNVVNQYGIYNSARMPSYHRLDISATLQLKRTNKFNSSMTFSVLNVYNRHNPFFIYPESSGDIHKYTMKVKPQEVWIFPILPSVSWQCSF